MSSLSDAFLQERQGELQRYIDRLVAVPALARCASVLSFFFGASEDPDDKGAVSAKAGDAFAALVAADTVRSWPARKAVPVFVLVEHQKQQQR